MNDEINEVRKITDATVQNMKPFAFKTIKEPDIIEYIRFHCQKLLELAKEKNESMEVAKAINLNTYEVLGPIFGEARSVKIDYLVRQMRGTDYAFLVLHNHPSGKSFSPKDIKTFVDAENMSVMIALGNAGEIYIVEKTRPFSLKELLSAKKTVVDWKHESITFEEMIEQIGEFGIVYSEL